jgi:adenosylcobinamide-GDP ribazoletransferase
MALAPAVGLLLGAVVAGMLWLLGGGSTWLPRGGWFAWAPVGHAPARSSSLDPFLAASLAVAALAALTRGLHLDGLADTADGLGSGRPADAALAVMRRGDVGPFGVVTLLVTLLVQVAALQTAFAAGRGLGSVVVAAVVSRLVLPLLCLRGVPAARADGLGHQVAGSVGPAQLAAAAALALAGVGVVVATQLVWWHAAGATGLAGVVGPLRLPLAVALPLLVAGGLALRCVRRLGGITGDVLGAGVEAAFTTCLLVLALT